MLRTRFAPSPNGDLHIGSARTALYNNIFAKNHDGEFILRFEEITKSGCSQKYVDNILYSLEQLGICWDDGPYFQKDNLDLYTYFADTLVENEWAYKKKDGQIIFKVPNGIIVKVYDVLHGEIRFETATINDFPIINKEGLPTYNFGVVVDDYKNQITHIIRGDDHISHTPKQVLLSGAMKVNLPGFAHIPLICGENGKPLTKTDGAPSVKKYLEMGILPDSLINYLALIGWGFDGKTEIFSRNTLFETFDIKDVKVHAGKFDLKKLKWVNSIHFEKLNNEEKYFYIKKFIPEKIQNEEKKIKDVIKALGTRLKNPKDFYNQSEFFFKEMDNYNTKGAKCDFNVDDKSAQILQILKEKFYNIEFFTKENVEKEVISTALRFKIKMRHVIAPLRIAISFTTVTPDIFETIAILGKKVTINRLDKAIKYINKLSEENSENE
ncbi:MAG: glutamate--tRNA ligase [Candidatus Muiribacteriota bacterium]